jgi:uncharacterized membrane protein YcjF (UPF0283 family)
MEPAALLASTIAKQQWFWGATAAIVAVLLLANVALFLFVYGRRLRELVRARRAAQFERESALIARRADVRPARSRAPAGAHPRLRRP